jgi:hypothetical protein
MTAPITAKSSEASRSKFTPGFAAPQQHRPDQDADDGFAAA